MGLTINLISGTHSYVRGEYTFYDTPEVLSNYFPLIKFMVEPTIYVRRGYAFMVLPVIFLP